MPDGQLTEARIQKTLGETKERLRQLEELRKRAEKLRDREAAPLSLKDRVAALPMPPTEFERPARYGGPPDARLALLPLSPYLRALKSQQAVAGALRIREERARLQGERSTTADRIRREFRNRPGVRRPATALTKG